MQSHKGTAFAGSTLNQRLEDVGWGLMLIFTGILWLAPDERVPHGTWLLGVGVILLGLNFVRYLKGIRVSVFTTLVGAFALLGGLGGLLSVNLPLFAAVLIVLGSAILFKTLFATSSEADQ
jgi:hypothetical protein